MCPANDVSRRAEIYERVLLVCRRRQLQLDDGRHRPLDRPVPSCPEWTAADLLWHLTEVQEFWGKIVRDLLESPAGMERIERPSDDELLARFDEQSAAMIDGLRRRDPSDACWSWFEAGHTVGWLRRRQAALKT